MSQIDITDKKLIQTLAKRFAMATWLEVGTRNLLKIDQKNQTAANRTSKVCASHDYTDASMTMNQVFKDSGLGDMSIQPQSADCLELWTRVWDYTKAVGFCRLRGIRSHDECPEGSPELKIESNELQILYPNPDAPVLVAVDYWGSNPRMQVMIYEANGSEEPVVKIRFTPEGKIQEVAINHVATNEQVPVTDDRHDTQWSKERDGNPACRPGDLLQMPSGQFGEVIRLRDRYDGDYEAYVRYDAVYQVAKRLHESRIGRQVRGMIPGAIVEALWEENPLTVATTDPTDLSIVPEDKSELPDPARVLNLK